MKNKWLIIGKALIILGILSIFPISLPALSFEQGIVTHIAVFSLLATLIGVALCLKANKMNNTIENNLSGKKNWLIALYFKSIKWFMIVTIVFYIIATCIILFFYWLNREFEATLLITLITGILIGLICEVAIPFYKNYHYCPVKNGNWSLK
ncbi:hypothetical protein [Phocaeicola coprophilus]|mgnify:CR=1 FL=1|uniref:hypothetical protein n=1 Tax=Phocaeicola coprophilus TaxID=387090 RepID=UPI003076EA78